MLCATGNSQPRNIGTKHAGHVRSQNYNIHSHSKSTLNSAVVALPSSLPVPWFNQNTVWWSREEARCASLVLHRPNGSCHRTSHVPCWTAPSCNVGIIYTLSVHRVPLHNCGIQVSLSVSLFHSGNLPALQCHHFILFSCSAPVLYTVSRVTSLCSSYKADFCTSLVPASLCVLVVAEHLVTHCVCWHSHAVCLFVWCHIMYSFPAPLQYQHPVQFWNTSAAHCQCLWCHFPAALWCHSSSAWLLNPSHKINSQWHQSRAFFCGAASCSFDVSLWHHSKRQECGN